MRRCVLCYLLSPSLSYSIYLDEASKNWKLSRRLPADFLELHASCYRTRSSITTFVGMTSLAINSPLLLPLPLLLLLLAAIRPCGGFPPPRPPRR